MQTNRIADRNRDRAEEKAAYDLNPKPCAIDGCPNTLTYENYRRGRKFCSNVCSVINVTRHKLGKPHPHLGNETEATRNRERRAAHQFATATWEGKIVPLIQDESGFA